MKRKLLLLTALILPLTSCDFFKQFLPDPPSPPNLPVEGDQLNIIALEMKGRYGDSLIIKYNDYDILVDAGTESDEKTVQDALVKYVTDKTIDLLILTHLHSDHIGAMQDVSFFKSIGMDVKTFIDPDTLPTSKTAENYVDMREAFVSEGSEYISYYDLINVEEYERKIYLSEEDNIYLEFFDTGAVAKPKEEVSDLNSSSIACVLNYSNSKVFMAGDLPSSEEEALIKSMDASQRNYFKEENQVLYKTCHHGSITSNGDELLTYVKPDTIFSMSGILSSNQEDAPLEDQHSYIEAINRMAKYSKDIYWTSINGTTVFSSKGDIFTKTFDGRTVDYYVDGKIISRKKEKDITFLNSAWYKQLNK